MISPMLLDSTDFDWISPINVEADFTDKIGSKLIMINLVSENFLIRSVESIFGSVQSPI
jgi:hypothetical protein